ncbi:NlpC/P60 family protein [Paraliomyxa miuraensis]|uniref:NlpC/P60 family protein n=1 Tax=Paraliomyxa miuraensis TaxID=376150 RepID=UPI0022509443|nr:NlpC/P60 family protein [Paraliomyxa miuraensis]MCX4245626.1 NlpC/P60 family protein [Paraliomyxa miuraensis]
MRVGNRRARSGVGAAMRGRLGIGWIRSSCPWVLWLGLGCGGTSGTPADAGLEPPASTPVAAAVECPTEPLDATVAPGTRPEHRDVEHWLAKLAPGQADEVLVPPAAVAELNARSSEVEGAWRDPFDPSLADPTAVTPGLTERMGYLRAAVDEGRMVEGEAGSLAAAHAIELRAATADELRLVAEEAPLWCVALDTGLYRPPVDPAFDRNRCASLHPGELVRVLRRSEDESWLYVHSGHTTGWLHRPSLTPPLPAAHLRPLWEGPRLVPLRDDVRTEGGRRLRLGTKVPVVGQGPASAESGDVRRVLVPTPEGLVEDTVRIDAAGSRVSEGVLPLTRRNLWTLALAEQDTPYGWGGTGGNRDCSRLVHDVMASFGIEMARHSGVQAKQGTRSIDVSARSEEAKLAELRRQAQRGAVLLHMPGHIMIYLGEEDGQHYAVSAISEYLVPCSGGPDTVVRIGRVAVTTLELGRGSERTAYIERLATLVVFAPSGGFAL